MTYLTYIERNKEMSDIPADFLYNPELDRWLDETRAPLSDDEMEAMCAYFHSESFRLPDNSLCVL